MGDAHDGEHWEAAPRRSARVVLACALVAGLVGSGLVARDGEPRGGALTVQPTPRGELGVSAAGMLDSGTQAEAWHPLPLAPVGSRGGNVLAWTGACGSRGGPPGCGELLLWGGGAGGVAYAVAGDAWRRLPAAPRNGSPPAAGVWTGMHPERPWAADPRLRGELVIWGAVAADRDVPGARRDEPRGVAYDPVSDRWRVLPEAPIAPRSGHSLTWTGSEVVVWGGRSEPPGTVPEFLADGAAYDPATNQWRRLPNAPMTARAGHAAAAGPDGTVVVFGSFDAAGQALADGAVYDPRSDGWTAIEPPPVAVVSPSRMFVPALAWMPADGLLYVVAPLRRRSRGDPLVVAYDLADRSWTTHEAGPIGLRSGAHAAAAEDGRLVVWGGRAPRGGVLSDGGLLSPATGDWQRIPAAPEGLGDGSALWLGNQLVVLAAAESTGRQFEAARFRPLP